MSYRNLSGNFQEITTLSACAGSETASRNSQSGLSEGSFTQAVLKGLEGEADFDKNRQVTLGELFPYIQDEIRRETNYKKDPQLAGPKQDDWVMGRVR